MNRVVFFFSFFLLVVFPLSINNIENESINYVKQLKKITNNLAYPIAVAEVKTSNELVLSKNELRLFDLKNKELKNIEQESDIGFFENHNILSIKINKDINKILAYKEWEKFVDDNIDNILFSGSKNGLDQLKKAKQLFVEKQKLFGINKIKKNGISIDDKAGKVVGKILNDPEITPTKTLDYIFGRGTVGRLDDSLSIVKKLKTIFGVSGKSAKQAAKESSDFQALRTGFFERLIRDSSRNGKFNPQQFANIFNTLKQRNKSLMKELFDDDEIKLMSEFVTEVEKTFKPKDLVNASNTASAISRTIQQVGRALVGIFGFKFANIQGLLAARGAFDRSRDIISQKQAQKLIEKEFTSNFGTTLSPKLDIASILAAQEITNQDTPQTTAPQIPPGLIQR